MSMFVLGLEDRSGQGDSGDVNDPRQVKTVMLRPLVLPTYLPSKKMLFG